MTSPSSLSFGAEVRRLREARKMTAAQLGRCLATSSTPILAIEAGKRYPRRVVVLQLAQALNCDANRLLDLCESSKAAAEEAKRKRRADEAQQCPEDEPTDPRLGLAWRIETSRRANGLSQAETERHCGMSKGYLRSVERADIFPLDVWLEPLADVLGVSLEDLQRRRERARAANTARLSRLRQLRRALGTGGSEAHR